MRGEEGCGRKRWGCATRVAHIKPALVRPLHEFAKVELVEDDTGGLSDAVQAHGRDRGGECEREDKVQL